MKSKIEITTNITLDEITYRLQRNLSTNELVNFVIQIGDKLTESEEYYNRLKAKLDKMRK